MPYTGDKLRQLERLGNDAINGDAEAATDFVKLALSELDTMADKQEKLTAKAVSLLAHIPEDDGMRALRDTLGAFRFWRASQSTEYWLCPCGCKSFFPIERTVCPVSGDVRALDLGRSEGRSYPNATFQSERTHP